MKIVLEKQKISVVTSCVDHFLVRRKNNEFTLCYKFIRAVVDPSCSIEHNGYKKTRLPMDEYLKILLEEHKNRIVCPKCLNKYKEKILKDFQIFTSYDGTTTIIPKNKNV